MKVKFVSIISRDDKPLYIQAFDLDQAEFNDPKNANKFLQYNFLSHMALDILASPISLQIREQQDSTEDNEGVILLFIQEGVTVYGYETSTALKLVIGLGRDDEESRKQENDDKSGNTGNIKAERDGVKRIKDIFMQIHKCYIKAICNPFSNFDDENQGLEEMLQNERFDHNIKRIVNEWNAR